MLTSARTNRPADVLLTGGTVIDPAAGIAARLDVSIRGGAIAAVGTALQPDAGQRVIDVSGTTIAPAFVDPHVHIRVPGGEDVETIATASRAGARGGYCAIVSMPNTDPVVDTPELLQSLHDQAAVEAAIPVGFAAAITVGQQGDALAELCSLADAGALLFSDDGRPVASPAMLRRAMQYQRVAERPLALHCEDLELTAGGSMHQGLVSTRLGLAGIHSLSEWTAVARDVRIALAEGARLHVQHLSCAESVAEIAWAKERGAAVTAEVTPHHLLLTDELLEGCDTNLKMNPPLRGGADRAALIDGLRDGTVDMVATDHAPHHAERKEEPFERAPFGVTGLETAFASLYTGLVKPGLLTLDRLIEAMSSRPAALLGIAAPTIAVGQRANLVVLDLEQSWTVQADEFESKSANSAFVGAELQGRVIVTVADGAVAWDLAPSEVAQPALAGSAV